MKNGDLINTGEKKMPNNVRLVDSNACPGKYELSINVNKETFAVDFLEAIKLLDQTSRESKVIAAVHFQGYFFDIDAQYLKPLFDKTKELKISTLGLMQVSGYGLGYFNNPNIQKTFALISDACQHGSLEKIDLTRNGIGNATLEQQTEIVQGLLTIVPYAHELNLSLNCLDELKGDLFEKIFLGCAQSNTLRVINLNYNQLTWHNYYEKAKKSCLEIFCLLFNERRKANKWEFLSLEGTGVNFLTNVEWADFLRKVNECCEGVNLSHNSLQAQTSEGRLDVYEEQDLIQIITEWLKITPLTIIDLSFNEFSIRNTQILESVLKKPQKNGIFVLEGNGLPNSIEYDKLLQEASDIKRAEEEEMKLASRQEPVSPLLYTNMGGISLKQPSVPQISIDDLQSLVFVFMENLEQKNRSLSQIIPERDVFSAVSSLFLGHGVTITPALIGSSKNPSNK